MANPAEAPNIGVQGQQYWLQPLTGVTPQGYVAQPQAYAGFGQPQMISVQDQNGTTYMPYVGGRTMIHNWSNFREDIKAGTAGSDPVLVIPWDYVKDLKDGRVSTYTSTAVVTTFFAAIEAALLTNSPTPPANENARGSPSTQRFYLFTTYAAMICAIGITISSLFLVDLLCTVDWKRKGDSIKVRRMLKSAGGMIMAFLPNSIRRQYLALEIYFYIFTYLGIALVIIQLLTYIWIYESNVLAGILTPMITLLVLPCLFRFLV